MKTLLIQPEFKRLGKWTVHAVQLWRSLSNHSPSQQTSFKGYTPWTNSLGGIWLQALTGACLGNLGHFFLICPCRSSLKSDAQRTISVCVSMGVCCTSTWALTVRWTRCHRRELLPANFSFAPVILHLFYSSPGPPTTTHFQLHSSAIRSVKLTNSNLFVMGANQHCLKSFLLFWLLL